MRSLRLEARLIAPKETALDDQVIASRKADYLRELQVRLPSLRYATAAEVELLTQSTDDGLSIEAHLRESRQRSLQLSSDRNRHVRHLQDDPFLQLIQRLEIERKRLTVEAVLASDSVSLTQKLSAGLPLDERVIELRREAHKTRKRHVAIPYRDSLEELLQFEIPPRLDLVEETRVFAKIRSIKRNSADIFDVTEASGRSVNRPSGQPIPRLLPLRRPPCKHHLHYGGLLQEAMDRDAPIQLAVGVRFSGTDARIVDLELLAVVE